MPTGKSGSEVDLFRTTGTDSAHERTKAAPDAKDMTNPQEVWREGETTPSATRSGIARGGRGRVADAGDLGQGQPSPYSTETQADAVARQTDRKDEPRSPQKPKQ